MRRSQKARYRALAVDDRNAGFPILELQRFRQITPDAIVDQQARGGLVGGETGETDGGAAGESRGREDQRGHENGCDEKGRTERSVRTRRRRKGGGFRGREPAVEEQGVGGREGLRALQP